MLFEERVRKFEYKLNDTDDQIIEYIIKNKEKAVTLSIQHLAAKLYTVPNTITRLSKKLGYDGFSHMKNSLKEELHNQEEAEEDSLSFLVHKTIGLLDQDKLAFVTKMIQEADHVLFFAVGDTSPLCDVMVKNLKIVGKSSAFYMHRHDMVHEINKLNSDDVLFLISLSGETSQVLDMAKLAKEKGVRLISLTHFDRNSLQQMADVNLYCYSPRKTLNGYNITDKTPAMIVLRVLSEYMWDSF
ncbi:MAG TPA: MurR/RpiR family transcriptional regulator [Bacillus sp. (in: firmicutes)]|uniref:MurR/RpiR family transcriptional regulator n=1 Tax=Bacillus litorisediminis TaxID=2922713 RepID=UPI001FAEA22C|nr:MurR/RpiR family transcriptional regulator [Bacillus litorisediminis]HWO78720.1 MurR/RpiR family transcriptional regulator [Bacillus sp. (in: firmicutes)]